MTVFLRDMSDYDSNEDMIGYVGVTHKATEGTTITHVQYGPRLNRYRTQGVQILGAYHVLRTPGSGGSGSLSSQLDFWLSTLDKATPWWRTHPHFILQIDLEKWPYDSVSSTTGLLFARMLVNSGVPGWKVTYASREQYGNSLTGIATSLWNAAYYGSTYPGDNASDWAQYSGKTPVLWQYTNVPFDKNAFRGSLGDLLSLIGAAMTSPLTPTEQAQLYNISQILNAVATLQRDTNTAWGNNLNAIADTLVPAGGVLGDLGEVLSAKPGSTVPLLKIIEDIRTAVTTGLPVTLSDADRAALVAAVPTAADIAAHIDYAALATALAGHFKVS